MKKRKILALFVALVAVIGLAACGGGGGGEKDEDSSANETANEAAEETTNEASKKHEFNIGETWVTDEWEMTVTGVSEDAERNPYEERQPAAVYTVDYTYTNTGFEDETGYFDGLYLSLDSSTVDNAGVMGYSYPNSVDYYPQETPVGATCKAQVCIGVDNAGSFKLNIGHYDSKDNYQKATFIVDVGE